MVIALQWEDDSNIVAYLTCEEDGTWLYQSRAYGLVGQFSDVGLSLINYQEKVENV